MSTTQTNKKSILINLSKIIKSYTFTMFYRGNFTYPWLKIMSTSVKFNNTNLKLAMPWTILHSGIKQG